MWIAEESLCAPLPAFWEDHNDEQGQVYYRNRRTGQTSRYHPLDKKYKKKVLQAKMGDLQSKLGEIEPQAQSTVAGQPPGLQQQYYQKILPQGPGAGAQMAPSAQPGGKGETKKGGFFSSLKQMARGGSKKDNAVAANDELNDTLQLLQKVEERAKSREQAPMRDGRAALSMPQGRGGGVAPPAMASMQQYDSANARTGRPEIQRKSRSRASFQLQAAAPMARQAGLPADPHDGGPHEDVKDMAIYLRLDPQRDYRFMWVSQVRAAASAIVPHEPLSPSNGSACLTACHERTSASQLEGDVRRTGLPVLREPGQWKDFETASVRCVLQPVGEV